MAQVLFIFWIFLFAPVAFATAEGDQMCNDLIQNSDLLKVSLDSQTEKIFYETHKKTTYSDRPTFGNIDQIFNEKKESEKDKARIKQIEEDEKLFAAYSAGSDFITYSAKLVFQSDEHPVVQKGSADEPVLITTNKSTYLNTFHTDSLKKPHKLKRLQYVVLEFAYPIMDQENVEIECGCYFLSRQGKTVSESSPYECIRYQRPQGQYRQVW
ncbi:MAG: hypothetical protein KDD46_07935 [Bdellovibrionales bacterium]|nr:hypothetical protein [Bdellovibrionales bacterium]